MIVGKRRGSSRPKGDRIGGLRQYLGRSGSRIRCIRCDNSVVIGGLRQSEGRLRGFDLSGIGFIRDQLVQRRLSRIPRGLSVCFRLRGCGGLVSSLSGSLIGGQGCISLRL